jgi:hypothetical protein
LKFEVCSKFSAGAFSVGPGVPTNVSVTSMRAALKVIGVTNSPIIRGRVVGGFAEVPTTTNENTLVSSEAASKNTTCSCNYTKAMMTTKCA